MAPIRTHDSAKVERVVASRIRDVALRYRRAAQTDLREGLLSSRSRERPEPDPATARDQAEFRVLLGELKRWAGYTSWKQVEDGAIRRGTTLQVSSAQRAMTTDRLPTAELVSRFVAACGGDVQRWCAVRDRLADLKYQRPVPKPDPEPAVLVDAGVDSSPSVLAANTFAGGRLDPTSRASVAEQTRPVPHQLPADTAHFVGRAEELHQLSTLLDTTIDEGPTTTGGGSTAVVISAVSGTAGVGKTALALRWAHRVRGEFPDGQLYVNLRGYDPDQPLSTGDALAGFLRALGMASHDIPLEVDERAAAYRSLLDGRRILIVLDNAATVEQIRPLLPGTPSAVVVVTSRDALAGLVARHGAHRLDLDLLPPEDAVALLGALIGGRVVTEPGAAAALAGQCAWLPLALRVAAELAATRPTTPLAALVGELADQQRRLELLNAGGDPRTAVRAVFSWSYQHLPPEVRRVFRLLGLHPGTDLDPYAAAALTHTSLDQAHHLLDVLARAHLIQTTGPGGYGMHDLLRAYATQLTHTEDSEAERRAALTRLFDHYLATAAAAMDTLHPAEAYHRPRVSPTGTPTPPMTDPPAAQAWLDAERATLTTVCAHTATHGWPDHTTSLASTLFRYLDVGGHYPDALTIHTHALHVARATGNQAGEAHALISLGFVYQRQGRYQQAAEHHQQALALARKIGDRGSEAYALGGVGTVYFRQGHYQQAAEHHQQSLALSREIGDRVSEAHSLGNLGTDYQRQGRYQQAAEHLQQALALFREIGNRVGEAHLLDHFGLVYFQQGHYRQAVEHHQQALALFREISDRAGEAKALNGLGETHHATGQLREARIQHTAALTLATQIGERREQARSHNGLAHTHHATGELDHAHHHWRHALTLYTDLGVPDADDVHAHLTALDQATDDDKGD